MAIELQSAKFFPGYFEEDAVATPDFNSNTPQPSETTPTSAASQYSVPAAALPQVRYGNWTIWMGVVAGLCGFMGIVGGLGGLWELVSITSLPVALEAINQMPASEETQITKMVLETQIQMQVFLYLCAGFRILLSVGFLVASFKMFKRAKEANEFVATLCAGTIFYYLTTAVLAWLSIPSFEGMGLGSEATQFASGFVLVMMVIGFLFNSAIFGAIMAYMYGENCRNYFSPTQA